jgi:hypothetical protein
VIGIGTGVIEMRTGRNGMGMRGIAMMARGSGIRRAVERDQAGEERDQAGEERNQGSS